MRVFIILILLIFHITAFACSGHGKPIEYRFDNAKKVFRGRIIAYQPVNVKNDEFSISHEITILTSVSFKGEVALLEKAYIDSTSSCGISLENDNLDNDEWVFYINTDNYTGQLTGTFTLFIQQKQSGEIRGVIGEDTLIKLKQLSETKT